MIWLLSSLVALGAPLTGQVFEKGTALPIEGATVSLPDGSSVQTASDGTFLLETDTEGLTTLTADGFDHQATTLDIELPSETSLKIYLLPEPFTGEIVVESFLPESDLTRHTVDAEMAYETPGTYDDVVRLVQALPGVNIQREFAPGSGDLAVRGSLPGDNRYYIDGVEVPYLYHFNQYASVLPASQIEELELFSSNFGVRFGDAVGAIVEAKSIAERPEKVSGSANINLITVGADIRAPLPKDWWISAAARRSFHDIAGGSIQYPMWPRFYDFSVRAGVDKDTFDATIYATGAGDQYERAVGELDLLDPVEQSSTPLLDYRRDYQLIGSNVAWSWGRFSGAVLHDVINAELREVPGKQLQRTVRVPLRLDLADKASEHISWRTGLELRPEWISMDLQSAGYLGGLITTEAPALAWDLTVDDTMVRLRGDAYGEVAFQYGPVRLMPGVRVGVDSYGWRPTVEPRLAARFRLAEQTALKVSGGRYQQRPSSALAVSSPSQVPQTDSWQVGGGLEQTIAGRIELGLDGYGKWLTNVLLQPPEGLPEVYPQGRAYGLEFTMRYRLREVFFLWTSFNWGRSLVFDEEGTALSTPSDQPFGAGVVASWNITRSLNVALRYRIGSGLPFTGIEGSTLDATLDRWIPRYGTPYGERLPLYQKIDLHVGYTFVFNRWSLSLYGDVWIVPPSSAQLYPTWNYDFTEQGWVKGPVVLPLLGLRATF